MCLRIGKTFNYNLPMDELPGSLDYGTKESHNSLQEKPSPLAREFPIRSEVPPKEIPKPVEEKEKIVLPPVLQADRKVQEIPPSVAPVSDKYLSKGPSVSKYTNFALTTFRQLQRKLELHYQKMRGQI